MYLSDHNGTKIEISNRRTAGKFTDMQKLTHTAQHPMLKREIKRGIKTSLEKNGNTTCRNLGDAAKVVPKGKVG